MPKARLTVNHGFSSATRWHATRIPRNVDSNGTSVVQRATAWGQRWWNAQPDGGASGEGNSPVSATRVRLRPVASDGVLANNARVYGCAGREKTSSFDAYSTV